MSLPPATFAARLFAQADATTWVETAPELARWTVGAGLVVGVGLTVALMYAVWWFYRHEGRGNVSTLSRRIMQALRCLVLMLLGLVGLEPVLARYLHRKVEATTVVLIDDSASMGVRDHYRDPSDAARVMPVVGSLPEEGVSRFDVVRKLAGGDGNNLVERLAKSNRVKVFRFSDVSKLVDTRVSGGKTAESRDMRDGALSAEPNGPATDLGRSLKTALDSVGGSPIAGVVLLTDGGVNTGDSADQIGRALRAREVKLSAIGVGDPAEVVNLRITEVSAPRNAFAKDPFTVTVQLAADGMDDGPIQVELLRRAPGASIESARPVGQQSVARNPNGEYPPLVFKCRVDEAGPVVFLARIAPLAGEAIATDNERETIPPVQILDNKMKVLLVAGAPTYDYRYLTHLLERDETVDVACWLQSADNRAVRDGDVALKELPVKQEELLQYDVIILLDPNPNELSTDFCTRVAALVEDYGGGLLYQADTKWTTQCLKTTECKPLVDLLPIIPDPAAELVLNQLGQFQRTAWPIRITPEAAAMPLLRQADSPAESLQTWGVLEGAYWHYPVKREKPAAQVLMRDGNPRMKGDTGPHVLYATQFVGAGRAAFLGFNSTWRWLRHGDVYFERFWVQSIRYLMEGKLLGGKRRGALMTERDEYGMGETVVVTLRALDERFEPLLLSSIELNVSHAGDPPRTTALAPVPGRDGFYSGRFVTDRVGALRLSVTLPGRGADNEPIARDIVVNQADIELRRPIMRRDVLTALASATGGKYYDVDQASRAADDIGDAGISNTIRERPIPLWDNAYVFGAILTLLTMEWIFRRVTKLL